MAAVRARLPGTPPFVEVGDPTEPDTVIGVIATMKLMTSAQAAILAHCIPGRASPDDHARRASGTRLRLNS